MILLLHRLCKDWKVFKKGKSMDHIDSVQRSVVTLENLLKSFQPKLFYECIGRGVLVRIKRG